MSWAVYELGCTLTAEHILHRGGCTCESVDVCMSSTLLVASFYELAQSLFFPYCVSLCLVRLRSPKAPDGNADVGTHKFTYSIMPHEGLLLGW